MKACKVSIILPVYNTSEYLDECIISLLSQTLDEIEIIAVNDGSTDNSFEILRKYQAENPNKLYVYNTENHGVSSARNYGVEKSCGEYLWFVDSDDYVEVDACEKLYSKAYDDNNDLILFGRYDIIQGEKKENKAPHFNQNFRLCDKPYEILKLSPFPWNKFIKRELFGELKFPEGIRFEDLPISFILASRAENIGVISDCLYDYRQQVGFLSKLGESTLDIIKAVDFMKKTLEADESFELYESELEYVTLRHFLYRLEQICDINGSEYNELELRLINSLFDYLEEKYPDYKGNPYIEYNLPSRLFNLLPFYLSRKAMIDFVNAVKDMTPSEQKAYADKLFEKYELVKSTEPRAFAEIKESEKAHSESFKNYQKNNELEKSAFIITNCKNDLNPSMMSLIKELRATHKIIIYTQDKAFKLDNSLLIHDKNDEYIRALALSEYVISDIPLGSYFEKKSNQRYINNLLEKTTAKLINKDDEIYDIADMQRAMLTADCTLYANEMSRTSIEKLYKVFGLGAKSICNYHPYSDIKIGSDIKKRLNAENKKLVAIAPQKRFADESSAFKFFRKYMSYLLILDRELDDNTLCVLCLNEFDYRLDMTMLEHIVKMPSDLDFSELLMASDFVVTDYHNLLTGYEGNNIVRFFADEKRYISDEELGIDYDYISFNNSISLAHYINEQSRCELKAKADKINSKALLEKINNGDTAKNREYEFSSLYYLGGRLTVARLSTFKKLRRLNEDKHYIIAFDEEQNPDYRELNIKSVDYMPLRFDSSSSFDEKMISSICSRGKPAFMAKKRLELEKAREWKKYFGDIIFDEITLISTGAIERNLLFLGNAENINYEFNWFSLEKYNSKKKFKGKVDYICSELSDAQSVIIPDEMKKLKTVKDL